MSKEEWLEKVFGVLLTKVIKPDVEIDSIASMNESELDSFINNYQIKGLILDVDETLRYNMEDIDENVQRWLDMASKKVKIIAVSNGLDKKIESFFNERSIDYISMAFKPFKYNLLKACRRLELDPRETAIIGDDLFEDIYGGKNIKMKTVLVKNINRNIY